LGDTAILLIGAKSLDGIVGDLGEQAGVHDEAGADDDQRVAIRRRGGDLARACVAAGAGPVLDIELLAEVGGQLVGDDAGNDVGGACGRERHHDLHRPIRIGLGQRAAGGNKRGKCHGKCNDQADELVHRFLPVFICLGAALARTWLNSEH
jgi:hypothetical protein